jgi:hypothetical protein
MIEIGTKELMLRGCVALLRSSAGTGPMLKRHITGALRFRRVAGTDLDVCQSRRV